ncbi:hypothetical protein APHAL10511_002410 [Amanita phalloides]|nr:hypothetical protein APHAL10511_002410 [Amanita phalloides]
MFKKPLGSLKNAAPLRASDRRKFKLRVLDAFGIAADIGDELVPSGMRSVKFTTYLDHVGFAYLAPQGDPLWFTLGKDSEELIPSIYTLWKHPDLLPFVATPTSVLPILVAGADLMAPGVIHHSPKIPQDQLVSVRQFNPNDDNPVLSPPLAVGRMAVPSDQLSEDAKGKAVLLFHTWKDHLWEMGSKGDIPEPQVQPPTDDLEPCTDDPEPSTNAEPPTYDPQQVTDILLQSLLQAISTLTPSSFPITSTHFYTNYILPCRPALANPHDITIKSSTHKTLTSFLKSAEKASLLTLKTPPKHAQQPDVLVMSVNAAHPNVVGHAVYKTVRDAEKRVVRNETQRDRSVEVEVRVLWKPHLDSVPLFKAMASRSTEKLYTMQEIKTLLNSYIASHNLVNPNVQAYINLDSLLGECIQHRSKKDAAPAPDDSGLLLTEGYMKREELLKKIVDKMQDWYEISREGQVTQKKGTLKPIQVVVKVRQGRKANTFITGFEPFLTVDAETIADDLRRACASATSVSSLPGKRGGTEVMVQGKHAKVVVEYLTSSGAPKPWIQLQD